MMDLLFIAIILAILSLLMPTLLDGVERKIKARIHSRIGPPILQSWYDVLKLFGKEQYIPPNSLHTIILIILYMIIQVFLMIFLYISIVYPLTSFDLFILISLIIVSQAIFISIPLTIPNPFSILGGSRELILALVNEATFIVLIGLYILYTGLTGFSSPIINTPIAIALLLVTLYINSYVSSGRIPFDIAEAEPELASGLLIELSGPFLGLFLYTLHVKRFFVKLLPTVLLLIVFIHDPLLLLILSTVGTVIIWIVYAVIAAILGRSRVDLAPITLLKLYLVLIVLSFIGGLLKI